MAGVLSISLFSAVFSRMAVHSYLAVLTNPQERIKECVVGHSEHLFISSLTKTGVPLKNRYYPADGINARAVQSGGIAGLQAQRRTPDKRSKSAVPVAHSASV